MASGTKQWLQEKSFRSEHERIFIVRVKGTVLSEKERICVNRELSSVKVKGIKVEVVVGG